MKLSSLIITLVLAAILSAGLVMLVFAMQQNIVPKGTSIIPYMFAVNKSVGFDLGTDMLRLGALSPGTNGWRNISVKDSLADVIVSNKSVSNNLVRKVRVEIRGEGKEWMLVEPAVLTLPGDVTVSVSVPSDASYGFYRGELLFIPLRNE